MRNMLALTLVCGFAVVAQAAPERPMFPIGEYGPGPNAQNGEVIFDNIEPNGGLGGSSPNSQYDSAYPFESMVADDFVLPDSPGGKWLVQGVQWSGGYFGGDLGIPLGFNIVIWPDAGGRPAGGSDGDHPDLTQAIDVQRIVGDANETPNNDGGFDYTTKIDPVHLVAGETYWLSIQAVFNFPPSWFWAGTLGSQGSLPFQGFPLLDLPFWPDEPIANDVAFILTGESVPEPASLLLLGGGALALRRRRR